MPVPPIPQFNFDHAVTVQSMSSHASDLSVWGQRGWARASELEHYIECAKTPMMADVLAQRDRYLERKRQQDPVQQELNNLRAERDGQMAGNDRLNRENTRLHAALEVAIQGLKDLAEPCTRYDYTFQKLNDVTCAIAQDRLDKTLAALVPEPLF